MAETYRAQRQLTPSGIWMLSVFNGAVDGQIKADIAAGKPWDQALASARDWARSSPRSAFALMLPARVLSLQAWSIRGDGPARQVAPADMASFKRLSQQADDELWAVRAPASVSPSWYEFAINLSLVLGKPRQSAQALFTEAVAREPQYLQAYFVMSRFHDPRWGGSAQGLEDFVRQAISRFPQRHQDALYARIYWWVADLGYFHRLTDSQVDCARMMRGARIVVEDYPDPWNTNNFARLAGQCGDQPSARHFLGLIGDRPLPEVWGRIGPSDEVFKHFKSWATE